MKMIQITDKKNCCGCTACAAVCPKDAITMKPDALGFVYPVVDLDKCVDCGLCEKVCAFSPSYETNENFENPIPVGARHKVAAEIDASRSGAAFVAISDWILEQGGVVYGAGYGDGFEVMHKRAVNKTERDEFRGSKYVQSNMGTTFRSVKQDLKDGRLVLFSGTPCQVAGLKRYVGERLRKNLYLADIVCHGVPSPYVWRDNLSFLEREKQSKVTSVNFRDKRKTGWRGHKETYLLENGKTIISVIYTYAFYKHIMFRDCCATCPFTNLRRPSDFSLADFWGWEKSSPTFNKDNRGASLVLLNTPKGKELFEQIKKDLNILPAELANCMQPRLRTPSIVPPEREEFIRVYEEHGFEHAMRRFKCLGPQATLRNALSTLKHKILG